MSKPFDLKPGYPEWLQQEADFMQRIADKRVADGDTVSAILFRNEATRLREEIEVASNETVTPLHNSPREKK
jgi:hypothetical protein